MTLRLVVPVVALLLVAACSRNAPAPATDAASAPAADTAAGTPAATAAATPLDPAAQAAVADILASAAAAPAPVAGTDYVEIANGQPLEPLDGKVEVVEIFGYTCPHCATFAPLMSAWKSIAPADVRVTYLPAPFGGYWEPYAKAYYAAEALGVAEASHDAVFRAIHIERALPVQPVPSNEQMGEFYTYVISGDSVIQSKVQLGSKVADKIVVREGLKAGDRIVMEGTQKLRPGAKVSLEAPGAAGK